VHHYKFLIARHFREGGLRHRRELGVPWRRGKGRGGAEEKANAHFFAQRPANSRFDTMIKNLNPAAPATELEENLKFCTKLK
jgi:hypothetical protein